MASRQDIVHSLLKGIERAQKSYSKLSGGWVWEAAEYWITTHIALNLGKLLGEGCVTVESNSEEAFESAGKQRGRPYEIVKNKRFDIVLWWRNGSARAPIEIKSQTTKAAISKDMNRVIAALKQANMEFGMVGYFYSRARGSSGKGRNAIELVEGYLERISDMCGKVGEEIKISGYQSEVFGDENDAWVAGCLLIEKKKRT